MDRGKLIKLIHVGRRELGMSDDTYRLMLANMPALGGKTSAKELDERGLSLVLEQLKAKGFKVKSSTQSRALANDKQSRLIRSLWLQLHEAGVVRDSSEAALASYVERITGVDALQWLNWRQASTVIETLKKWLKRFEVK